MAGVISERGLRPIYSSPMLSLLTRTKSFRDPWVGHPANTLVYADVFDFHRRGAAVPGWAPASGSLLMDSALSVFTDHLVKLAERMI